MHICSTQRSYSIARAHAKLAEIIDDVEAGEDMASVTWHELRHGAGRLPKGTRRSPPPFVDGPIAAIAVVNGLPLVTANPRDFRAFKGLPVLNWAAP